MSHYENSTNMKCYGFLYIVQRTIQFGYCCRKKDKAETHQIRMNTPLDSEPLFSLNLLETTKRCIRLLG